MDASHIDAVVGVLSPRKTYQVYLAGPITGLTYAGATDWRDYATERLTEWSQASIESLSPMRGKRYLAAERNLAAGGYDRSVLSCRRGITTRDRFDCMRADALIVNFLGAKQLSAGTAMEIAWADLLRKPVIVAMEREGNPHDHAMITECIGFRCETLDEAIITAVRVLCP